MTPGSPFLSIDRALAPALALAAAFCALAPAVRADVPDLTASLEFVGNPAMHRWPADSHERGAHQTAHLL